MPTDSPTPGASGPRAIAGQERCRCTAMLIARHDIALAPWLRADDRPTLRVSVICRHRSSATGGWSTAIRSALDDADLQARYLEVELTESAV